MHRWCTADKIVPTVTAVYESTVAAAAAPIFGVRSRSNLFNLTSVRLLVRISLYTMPRTWRDCNRISDKGVVL